MLQKNKGGRPRIAESERLCRHIHCRITESEYGELEKKCQQASLTMGRYIITAVKNAQLTKGQGSTMLGEIQMMNLSMLLRAVIESSEVKQSIPTGAEVTLRKIEREMKSISRDAMTIAKRVSGEHYHTVYVDTLQRMQTKVKQFMNEYLNQTNRHGQ